MAQPAELARSRAKDEEGGELLGAAPAPGTGRLSRWASVAPVVGVVAFLLVELAPETTVVAYDNDSAVHAEMVRFATARLRSGHLPLNEWFPFLNLGSPEFLHYQSLPAMLTGAVGLLVGPNHAFAWSLYLLLASWPVSVYLAARLLRIPPWGACVAAVVAPFIVSAPGLGYEQSSYLFIGFGMWTQLWGMWLLPLAWGFTFRAITEGRFYFGACLTVAGTMAVHFMTGYLAVIPIVVLAFLVPSRLSERLVRGGAVLAGSLLAGSWVLVPLLRLGKFAAINEFLATTSHAESFGARRELSWFVEGGLLDFGRAPIITAATLLGLAACVLTWQRSVRSRALVAFLVIAFLLFFGKPTWGPLLVLLPGSKDLFLRRYVMGVELASIFLAGFGAVALARGIALVGRPVAGRLTRFLERPGPARARRAFVFAAGVALVVPVALPLARYDARNASAIRMQARADRTEGRQLDALISRIKSSPPGRVYAGLPYDNWGVHFRIGDAEVLEYLASGEVDEVGFTLRTASLMENPEAYFDEHRPGDYKLFGVRYLVLPADHPPPVPANETMRRGRFVLWTVTGVGYVQVVETRGTLRLDSADIGRKSASFIRSSLPGDGVYPTVRYYSSPAARPTMSATRVAVTAGTVESETIRLASGRAAATVRARRPAVVLLSASWDPNWEVTVDGRARPVEMIAPALVGVRVGPGRHTVVFHYAGTSGYPLLFALSAVALVAAAVADLTGATRRALVARCLSGWRARRGGTARERHKGAVT